jgi:hypothetical protein
MGAADERHATSPPVRQRVRDREAGEQVPAGAAACDDHAEIS